jgi:hypothetical protein
MLCLCRKVVKFETDSCLTSAVDGLEYFRDPLSPVKKQTGRLRLGSNLVGFQSRYWIRFRRENFQCH